MIMATDQRSSLIHEASTVPLRYRPKETEEWTNNPYPFQRRRSCTPMVPAQGTRVNRDLWEPLIEIVRQRGITFRWVKGHSGDPMNELVDQLAAEAGRTQQGRQGVTPELGYKKLSRTESSGWPSRRR